MSGPDDVPVLYGSSQKTSRIRTRDLSRAKERGEKWAMLTSYDYYSASLFDAAGIPVLLVGDSAANTVYGYPSTVLITEEELLPLVKAVSRGAERALVVADLPFGSYEAGPAEALESAVRFMKAGAHAIKLEGGTRVADQISALTDAGIPVMAHIGFTPQSEHQVGGYRVAGRADAAQGVVSDAKAVEAAGAFAVVLEMVTSAVSETVTNDLAIPTIGIGAGSATDAQVLVWQDMAGLNSQEAPRFVKRYADLAGELSRAAQQFAQEVRDGQFPTRSHGFG